MRNCSCLQKHLEVQAASWNWYKERPLLISTRELYKFWARLCCLAPSYNFARVTKAIYCCLKNSAYFFSRATSVWVCYTRQVWSCNQMRWLSWLHSLLLLKNNWGGWFFFFWVNFYHFHELSCLLERSDSTKLAQGRAGDQWGKEKERGHWQQKGGGGEGEGLLLLAALSCWISSAYLVWPDPGGSYSRFGVAQSLHSSSI